MRWTCVTVDGLLLVKAYLEDKYRVDPYTKRFHYSLRSLIELGDDN